MLGFVLSEEILNETTIHMWSKIYRVLEQVIRLQMFIFLIN